MSRSARLTIVDRRRTERHVIDHVVTAENREIGEISLRIVNISPQGMMVWGSPELERGTRIEVRLPVIGKIEGYLAWSHGDRAGFHLERLIRPDDFAKMLSELARSPVSS